MFENIGINEIRNTIAPDMVENELKKHNDILSDKYKTFIYWFNKQVTKAITRFEQGKDKNDLKNHYVRIDSDELSQDMDNLLNDCTLDFIEDKELSKEDAKAKSKAVNDFEDFLAFSGWEYRGYGFVYSNKDSDCKHIFHWINPMPSSQSHLKYNPYIKASKTIKIITGDKLAKYDNPDIAGFNNFFNHFIIQELNDETKIKDKMNKVIKLYNRDIPKSFRYISRVEPLTHHRYYCIYRPYLDQLIAMGWGVKYIVPDYSSLAYFTTREAYYEFIY